MSRVSASTANTSTLARNLLIVSLTFGIVTPLIWSFFSLKSYEKCNVSRKLKSYLWSAVFLLSVMFTVLTYLSSSVFLFVFLLLVALYVEFYGVDNASTKCEDFATTEVCNNIKRFVVPDKCSTTENVRYEMSCDREKWDRAYTSAFFPVCKLGEINSSQKRSEFSYKCSETALLSLLSGFSVVGLFVALIQKLG